MSNPNEQIRKFHTTTELAVTRKGENETRDFVCQAGTAVKVEIMFTPGEFRFSVFNLANARHATRSPWVEAGIIKADALFDIMRFTDAK